MYQYLEKRRPRLRLQDTAGTLVHNVLCDFFAKKPSGERTGELLLSMFDERWAALSPRYLRIPSVEGLRRRARAQLERFAQEADLKANPLLVEASFQIDLAPGVLLTGRIDRVDEEADGSLSVLDYKTSEPPDEVHPRQLYLYALMVESKVKRPVSRGSFWHLADDGLVSLQLDEKGKAQAAEDARDIARQMEAAQEFPPNIGRRCGYCPYLSSCDYKDEIATRRQREGW
jgi:RecB family exonuclease